MTDAPLPPPTPDEAAALWALWTGAELPGACRAGVASGLTLLAAHRRVVAAALDDAAG